MHAQQPIVMSAAADLGDTLRRAREHLGLSREQLARATTIPIGDLEAIEAGLIGALPRGMFRRAEIRAYAEAVGLDPAATLAAFLIAERAHAVPSPPGVGTNAVGNPPDAFVVDATSASPTIASASRARARHASARAPASPPGGLRKQRVPGRPVDRVQHVRAIHRRPLFALAGVGLGALALIQVTTPDSRRPAAAAVQEPTRETVATGPVAFSPADHGRVPDATDGTLQRAAGDGRRDGEALHPAGTRRPVPPGAQPVRLVPPRDAIAEAPSRARPARASPVLVVRTRPRGARVTVNGIGRGEGPVTVRYLSPGVVRIRVVSDGFQSEERLVRLPDSGTETVTISLRRRR